MPNENRDEFMVSGVDMGKEGSDQSVVQVFQGGKPLDPHKAALVLFKENQRLKTEIENLQATSRVLTCVYCGSAYPPGTLPSNQKVLHDHIEGCERHPLFAARKRILELEAEVASLQDALRSRPGTATAGS